MEHAPRYTPIKSSPVRFRLEPLLVAVVVDPRGVGRCVPGDVLSVLQDTPVFEEGIDAGGPGCMASHFGRGDAQFDAGALAVEMALSPRQLTRRLKEVTGEAPAALIRRLRLERAAQLLTEDEHTVSETADAVGYDSPSHFAKAFRKRFGCAPSEHDDA